MIYTHGEHIVDYVRRKISDKISFQNPTGIGLADESGKILLGVVIDNHRIESNSVCISLAISDKKHFTRKFIKQIFRFIFTELKIDRITAMIESSNDRSLSAIKRLGFEHEGIMRKASYNKQDLHVFGMLKGECRWI